MQNKQELHSILWTSFKKGDWEAYTSLYHSYYGLLNNYGYKFTKDVNLIEDAIHDLFVRLWSNRENLGDPISVKNYLLKALRNILFRKIKAQMRFSNLHEDDDGMPFELSFDSQLILTEEERKLQEVIKGVLNTLPRRQQEIIYLRFYDGLSYEEIADIMGINVNSTYKLLYKALENLRGTLAFVGIGLADVLTNLFSTPGDTSQAAMDTRVMHSIPIDSLTHLTTNPSGLITTL